MTVLICLCALLLLLFILLLFPVRASLRYDGAFSVEGRYLFFRFPIYPKRKPRLSDYSPRKVRKMKRKRKQAREKERLKARLAQKHAAKPRAEGKPKETTPEKILRIVRLVLYVLRNTYYRIRIRRLFITVASDDAAKTAILYGVTAQSVAYLLATAKGFVRLREDDGAVGVVADFLATTSSVEIHLTVSTTPLHVLIMLLRRLFSSANNTKKQVPNDTNKNGVKEK